MKFHNLWNSSLFKIKKDWVDLADNRKGLTRLNLIQFQLMRELGRNSVRTNSVEFDQISVRTNSTKFDRVWPNIWLGGTRPKFGLD